MKCARDGVTALLALPLRSPLAMVPGATLVVPVSRWMAITLLAHRLVAARKRSLAPGLLTSETHHRKQAPETETRRKAHTPATDKPLPEVPREGSSQQPKHRTGKSGNSEFVDHFAKQPQLPPRPPLEEPPQENSAPRISFTYKLRLNLQSRVAAVGRWYTSNAEFDYDGDIVHVHRSPATTPRPESRFSTASSTQESAISEYRALPADECARKGYQFNNTKIGDPVQTPSEWRRRVRIMDFVKVLVASLKEKDLLKKLGDRPPRQPAISKMKGEGRGHGKSPSSVKPRARREERNTPASTPLLQQEHVKRAQREQHNAAAPAPIPLLPEEHVKRWKEQNDFATYAAGKHAHAEAAKARRKTDISSWLTAWVSIRSVCFRRRRRSRQRSSCDRASILAGLLNWFGPSRGR